MDKLNILVIHSLGDPAFAPFFLKQHVFALRTEHPEHNYIYHDTALALPDFVKDADFDAIILDVTLLCARWGSPEQFRKLKESFSFVKDSNAVKIAFPQDEYDCNEILDDWMCEWNIDLVYSVISSNWDILYPNYHKHGKIRLGYTGYINEKLIDYVRKPFDDRTIDVGYRARKLPPYFGHIGEIKWTIGRDVEIECKKSGLRSDIILGESGYLGGHQWLDFINDCKFTLGSNSGSSLLDPNGNIQRKVKKYLAEHPDAEFEEVESQCFKDLDRRYSFTAISPRVMEAALLDSCQILVEGEYSGIIQPWEHYIPIKEDASDFDEVFRAMQDKGLVSKMISSCRIAILDDDNLRYRNKANTVIETISALASKKHTATNTDEVTRICSRYNNEMTNVYTNYWRRQEYRQKLVSLIDRYPSISRLVRKTYRYTKGLI